MMPLLIGGTSILISPARNQKDEALQTVTPPALYKTLREGFLLYRNAFHHPKSKRKTILSEEKQL